MFVLLASMSHAATLPLPMPTHAVCPAGSAVEAQVAAGRYPDEGWDWTQRLTCEDEADCLAQIARIEDPKVALAAEWVAEGETDTGGVVTTEITLGCVGSASALSWVCDGAGCTLTGSHEAQSGRWTSLNYAEIPGRPGHELVEILDLDERTFRTRTSTQVADVAVASARRMDAVLGKCTREGVNCPAGWEDARRMAQDFTGPARPHPVSFVSPSPEFPSFEVTYASAAQPDAEVTLSCFQFDGGCGVSETGCTLVFGRPDAPVASFATADDRATWSGGDFAVSHELNGPVVYTLTEGWQAFPAEAESLTAAR